MTDHTKPRNPQLLKRRLQELSDWINQHGTPQKNPENIQEYKLACRLNTIQQDPVFYEQWTTLHQQKHHRQNPTPPIPRTTPH